MRLLFATDIHGLPGHLLELASWTREYQPQVLLIGGDALPDADCTDPAGSQTRFALTEMRRYLEAIKTQLPGVNIGIMVGNHDWLCSYDALGELERSGLLRVLRSDNSTPIAGQTFLGYSCTPPSPYPVKDFERFDVPGQAYLFDGGLVWDRQRNQPMPVSPPVYLSQVPSMREDLAKIPIPDVPEWIFVSHAPPARTDLDILAGIGHVGSLSIREFILRRQPLLSLHGHIHESPRLSGRFWQRLGRTVAINPGQRADALAGVLIDLSDQTITLTPLGIEGDSGKTPVSVPRPLIERPA